VRLYHQCLLGRKDSGGAVVRAVWLDVDHRVVFLLEGKSGVLWERVASATNLVPTNGDRPCSCSMCLELVKEKS
jgi:hypothetical protein